MFRSPSLAALLLGLLSCLLATTGHAQFLTNIKLNKGTYLTFEGVEATVTLVNRSGADVVMGGPSGMPWMTFSVTDPTGREIPSLRLASDQPFVLKGGATIARKVILSDLYAFSQYGNYFVSASVYHPPSQRYYASNRTHALFTDAKMFWEQAFGVPTGQPGAGQIRRYTLSTLRDQDRIHLYVRLIDQATNSKLVTFSLGTCIMIIDPQVTVDTMNNLHVLFMTVPKIYAHIVINPQGRIERRNYHREIETNRPRLIVQTDGAIAVAGGVPYDPSAAPQENRPPGRSISEKPPGL